MSIFTDERAEQIRLIKAQVQQITGFRLVLTSSLAEIVALRQGVIDNTPPIWNNPSDLNSLNAKLLEEKNALQAMIDALPGS